MNRLHGIVAVLAFVFMAAGVTYGIVHTDSLSQSSQLSSSDITTPSIQDPQTFVAFDAVNNSLPVVSNVNVAETSNTNTVPGEVAGAATRNVSTNLSTTPVKPKPVVKKKAPVKKPAPKPAPVTNTNKNTNTSPSNPGTGTTLSVEITFYGAYDNDPPGSRDISNPVKHSQAGGTGTYADPMTFASPNGSGAYAVGTIIYVPRVQKYFIKEDECAVSWTAPNGCGATSHVDLYIGNPSDSQSVLNCEDALTPNGNATIIVNPPSNLTYDPTLMWNQATGACMQPH